MLAAITTIRNWCYDRNWLKTYTSTIPVISVGNLTVGGNGKTPLCLAIAHGLTRIGFRPAILSRGYRGQLSGPWHVSTLDSAFEVGDEALLMARVGYAPVIVAKDRVLGAQWIEQHNLANVIILDDGFQHRRLNRQLDLLAVDISSQRAIQSFVDGRVMPLGAFREGRKSGLKRADAVVFSCRGPKIGNELPSEFISLFSSELPRFMSYMKPVGVIGSSGLPLPPQSIVAFCGLRNPSGFFRSLVECGFKLEAEVPFPDHHTFSKTEIAALGKKYPGIPLVCTQKDWVKVSALAPENVFVLKAEAVLEPWLEFVALVEQKLDLKSK